jgi:predicted TPR repeat methyltransferase
MSGAAPGAGASAMLTQAMAVHRDGDFDEARRRYEALLAAHPEHPDGLHMLGVLEGQLRNHARAIELIGRAAALLPEEPMFHNNLGNALQQAERYGEAEAHYRRAIALEPRRYDAVNNLAVLQGRRGDVAGAEATFKALLAERPDFTDARQNLASLYLRHGRLHDAIEQCVEGLVTAPRAEVLRVMLGAAYNALDMHEQALELYQQWYAEDPTDPQAAHYLAAYTGQRVPERASDDYVRTVFDSFAQTFDAKLGRLDYAAPALVGRAVTEVLGTGAAVALVVDLGCGTGLCGSHLRPHARRLEGVDLSGPMLEKAAARSLYDALYQSELVAFLRERRGAIDLAVSADTLCYFGRLDEFADAAYAALVPGGWLVFTVEAHSTGNTMAAGDCSGTAATATMPITCGQCSARSGSKPSLAWKTWCCAAKTPSRCRAGWSPHAGQPPSRPPSPDATRDADGRRSLHQARPAGGGQRAAVPEHGGLRGDLAAVRIPGAGRRQAGRRHRLRRPAGQARERGRHGGHQAGAPLPRCHRLRRLRRQERLEPRLAPDAAALVVVADALAQRAHLPEDDRAGDPQQGAFGLRRQLPGAVAGHLPQA